MNDKEIEENKKLIKKAFWKGEILPLVLFGIGLFSLLGLLFKLVDFSKYSEKELVSILVCSILLIVLSVVLTVINFIKIKRIDIDDAKEMLVKKRKKPNKEEAKAYINQITKINKIRYNSDHNIIKLDIYVDEYGVPVKINNVKIDCVYGDTTVYLKAGNHKICNEILPLYDMKDFYVVVKGHKKDVGIRIVTKEEFDKFLEARRKREEARRKATTVVDKKFICGPLMKKEYGNIFGGKDKRYTIYSVMTYELTYEDGHKEIYEDKTFVNYSD